jgi:hypothetical protein
MTEQNAPLQQDVLENIVELSAIAKKYFGITPRIANRKACLNDLPVKAFRLSGSRRGPLFVRKSDLEGLIPKGDGTPDLT